MRVETVIIITCVIVEEIVAKISLILNDTSNNGRSEVDDRRELYGSKRKASRTASKHD